MDDITEIGVIELKTCIQAIVTASPELVAKLGQDYTVYAYDYSEYETPLVGQGMLSWVLASASSTPSAPAHQSRTVVTGRVCKNILGLFSNGAQETLEVKLRLVPVPTCLQSEYLSSMQQYRELSKVMPEGFDAGAWTAFLQANPAIMQLAEKSRCQTPLSGVAQRDTSGLELVHQMLSDGTMPRSSEQHLESYMRDVSHQPERRGSGFSGQLSRTSSPVSGAQSSTRYRQSSHAAASRPTSSASNQAFTANNRNVSNPLRRASMDTGYMSNDEGFEEPSKKRAKITKAEWPGKSNFGKLPESLRVAASTAASVRVHQPTPMRPSTVVPGSLEDPPRAPTPIPSTGGQMHRRSVVPRHSSLRTEASDQANSATYNLLYDFHSQKTMESSTTSPEDSQAGSIFNTPPDMASSPPVMRPVSPAPSSPALPTHRDVDSGFMSGPIDEVLGEEDEEMRPVDGEDLEIASQYSKRADAMTQNEQQVMGFPLNRGLPRTFVKRGRRTRRTSVVSTDAIGPQEDGQSSASRQNSQIKVLPIPRSTKSQFRGKTAPTPNPLAASAMAHRSSSTAVVPLVSVPASDPIWPCPNTLQRSQTWSGQQLQHPASDAPTGNSHVQQPSPEDDHLLQRSGSGAKRKKAIQERLETSIATGEMPPYCENCGAIETPTWRKAWVRIHSGGPELVRLSNEEGGVIAWETLETDQNGNIILFRIIKRSLLPSDAGFTEILLCNRTYLLILSVNGTKFPQLVVSGSTRANACVPRRSGTKMAKTNREGNIRPENQKPTPHQRGRLPMPKGRRRQ